MCKVLILIEKKWEKTIESPGKEKLDFSDIRGQESLKRAVEIAVSGFHNLLMIGPPGAGKRWLREEFRELCRHLHLMKGWN